MPIYEYVCPACNLEFELLRSLSQATEGASCPQCHNQAERKLSIFAAMSKDESGAAAPLSSPCTGCSATSCDTCST